MSEYILVHGAFFGGWCWDTIAGNLRAQGHVVYTPTLKGLAERHTELSQTTGLYDHIADVVRAIDNAHEDKLILVGHSYGGMPVMGAADQRAERIASILFLDAFVPEHGESAQSIREGYSKGQDKIELPPAKNNRIPPLSAKSFGISGERAALVDGRLTSHPELAVQQPISLADHWQSIAKKTYLRTRKFPAPYFDKTCENLKNKPDWQVFEKDQHHCLMLTEPNWLLEFFKMKL